jgi:hypothetical protein
LIRWGALSNFYERPAVIKRDGRARAAIEIRAAPEEAASDDRFSEGFETADLKTAKSQLNLLQ